MADVHERVVGIDDQLRRIALKVGVASLLGLLVLSALLNARRVIVAETCSPPCARGYHCVSGNKCEPDKSTPAAKKAALEPSSVYVAIPHAAVACSRALKPARNRRYSQRRASGCRAINHLARCSQHFR